MQLLLKMRQLQERWFPRRVPSLQQLTTVECGAACLAMILNYFGRTTTVAEAREACVVGRDGLRASTIAQTARRFGLQVRAFSSDIASLQMIALPAILHWELNHFVVLERLDPRGAAVVDPALGRQLISMQEFSERFSGVVLTFRPTPDFKVTQRRVPQKLSWITHLLTLSAKSPYALPIASLAVLVRTLSFSFPLLVWLLIDGVVQLQSMGLLYVGGAIAFLLLGLSLVLQESLASLVRDGDRNAHLREQQNFVRHLFKLPVQFFQQRSSGDLLMRAQSSTYLLEFAGGHLVAELADAVTCLAVLAALAFQAYGFVLLLLLVVLGRMWGLLRKAAPRQQFAQEEMRRTSQQQGYLLEVFRGAVSLKASASEASAIERWTSLLSAQMNAHSKRTALADSSRLWETALGQLAPGALLLMGAAETLSGRMSLGRSAAAAVACMIVYERAGTLANLVLRIRDGRGHWERIQDVLTSRAEQTGDLSPSLPPLQDSIEMRHLSFRFTPDSPWVVRDVNCTLAAGQKVAIVGTSGSGKSTLAMLLLGLYRPGEGEVLFDGQSLTGVDLHSLRQQVGVVLQEQFLFGGSIRQNIAFGHSGMTLEQVAQAAQFAGIHEEITRMPMGYETVLYEGGTNLSGGQRQRLLIARAIASKPRLLLLDEATSHLDTLSEAHVDQSLSRLSCTRIVIAHRLSTVRNADRILVLRGGVLVEMGVHEELLAQDGEYKKLCSTMT